MIPSRETVLTALFTLLKASSSYATASRRVQLWTDVTAFPAIFMAERGDNYGRENEAVPAVVTYEVSVFIYTNPGKDSGVIPATILNSLLDALDAALMPSPLTGLQTLNNTCSHCWIEGKIMKDPGDLDGYGLAVVPVKIMVAQ